MRKIEERICDALDRHIDLRYGGNRYGYHDKVESFPEANLDEYFLLGSLILEYNYSQNSPKITIYCNMLRRYHSNTTKSRINAVCRHFNLPIVYQKDFIWYWSDNKPFEENRTFIVKSEQKEMP